MKPAPTTKLKVNAIKVIRSSSVFFLTKSVVINPNPNMTRYTAPVNLTLAVIMIMAASTNRIRLLYFKKSNTEIAMNEMRREDEAPST